MMQMAKKEIKDMLVLMMRSLSKVSMDVNIMLPVEMVDIIEGKKEKSFKEVSVFKVLGYLASMLEE